MSNTNKNPNSLSIDIPPVASTNPGSTVMGATNTAVSKKPSTQPSQLSQDRQASLKLSNNAPSTSNSDKPVIGGAFKIPKEKLLSPSADNKMTDGLTSSINLSSKSTNLISGDDKQSESPMIRPQPVSGASTPINNQSTANNSTLAAAAAAVSLSSNNNSNDGLSNANNNNMSSTSSAILNKQIISNLNKSLKAKQKIINSKEPHPKNSSVISEIVNTSPRSAVFPNDISGNGNSSSNNLSSIPATMASNVTNNPAPSAAPNSSNSQSATSNEPTNESTTSNTSDPPKLISPLPANPNTLSSVSNTPGLLSNKNDSLQTIPSTINQTSSNNSNNDNGNTDKSTSNNKSNKSKQKKIAKQNSTRTDFFAAKLASAVDDVESSDSDETFVYENNNLNDFDDNATTTASNIPIDNASTHGSVFANNENPPIPVSSPSLSASNHFNAGANSENILNHGEAGSGLGSIHGINLGNGVANSPSVGDSVRDDTIDFGNHYILANRAESIRSMHSSKLNYSTNSPTNIKQSNPQIPSNLTHTQALNYPMESSYSSNHYLENVMKSRPSTNRQSSSFSIPNSNPSNDDKLLLPLNIENQNMLANSRTPMLSHSPVNHYTPSSHQNGNLQNASSHNAASSFGINFQNSRTHSINDDDRYSYDEVDDEAEIDDVSTEGEYFSPSNQNGNGNSTKSSGNKLDESNYSNGSANVNFINQQVEGDLGGNNQGNTNSNSKVPDNVTVSSKMTSKKNYNKSSNSSSKLRSTTSKLFNKKGNQPRRYSIIPDDIDIEDFDDELIYYDNNIRFPYNGTNNNSGILNENSPLINQNQGQFNNHPRIPHYRSLNLNVQNSKKPINSIKNKRYLSMGQPPFNSNNTPGSPLVANANNANSDIFPFPYPDPHQNYYYDLDEYDEEAQFGSDPKAFDVKQGHPHLSPNSGHFFLPRKVSRTSMKSSNINCIKSFIYTLISILCILAIGFVLGFILASTKDLANVSIVSIENTLVSQDELIFNVVVEAFNPGWFTVNIEEVEIDIFAKSGYLPDLEIQGSTRSEVAPVMVKNTVETVLLGSVFNLESTLEFEGGFFNRDPIQQTGTIKLISPGKNLTNFNSFSRQRSNFLDISTLNKRDSNSTEPDNSKKWEIISKNPFDLILRGILKYNLPMTKNVKSVVINKVGYVDPNQDGLRKKSIIQ